MMEAVWTSETLLNLYQSTQRYSLENSHLLPEISFWKHILHTCKKAPLISWENKVTTQNNHKQKIFLCIFMNSTSLFHNHYLQNNMFS
jgi:hypothetical protein